MSATDVFHLVRLGLQVLDEVRRRRQKQTHGHRGRKDDPTVHAPPGASRRPGTAQRRGARQTFDRLREADTDNEVGATWVAFYERVVDVEALCVRLR